MSGHEQMRLRMRIELFDTAWRKRHDLLLEPRGEPQHTVDELRRERAIARLEPQSSIVIV